MKITCRSCGKEYDVQTAGEYCCTCGSSINASEPSHGPERKEKECPACGEMILESAKKCKHCGEWVDGSHRTNNIMVSHSERSRFVYVFLTLVFGTFGVGEFYIKHYKMGMFFLLLAISGIITLFFSEAGTVFLAIPSILAICSILVNWNIPEFDITNQTPPALICDNQE